MRHDLACEGVLFLFKHVVFFLSEKQVKVVIINVLKPG
jgi:hypothetical protein